MAHDKILLWITTGCAIIGILVIGFLAVRDSLRTNARKREDDDERNTL